MIVSHLALDDDGQFCHQIQILPFVGHLQQEMFRRGCWTLMGNDQPQDQDKGFLLQHEHNGMGT